VKTLLHPSRADWALAKRREEVLSKLAESKECSRTMIQKASAALRLSRAMVFRLLARYKEDRSVSALLLRPRGRKRGSGGLQKEQEQIITAHIRKFCRARERRPVTALHREIVADCVKSRLGNPSYGSVLRRLQVFAHVSFRAQRASGQGAGAVLSRSLASSRLSGVRSTGFRKKRSTH
jgi:putative transposase